MKSSFIIVLSIVALAVLSGCGERGPGAVGMPDINIDGCYYVAKNDSLSVRLTDTDGSRFMLNVMDDDILYAELTRTQGETCMTLWGKEVGETKVMITDSTAGGEYTTTVVVTESGQPLCYLALEVVESSHFLFKSGCIIFLADNDNGSAVYFNPADEGTSAGRYGISAGDGGLKLSLSYTADENGFIDSAIAPETESFDMSGSPGMLDMLISGGYIDGDLNDEVAGFDRDDYDLRLKHDGTEITCVLTDTELPDVIL